jgi:hypothetical protein
VRDVFSSFVTTELTTVDEHGQPITWPVTPYYSDGASCIDVTTPLGYPKKANDARANPLVSLLFSDPTGSGVESPPMVLVQGSADVDDRDLEANRERYARESAAKRPNLGLLQPPEFVRRFMGGYFSRIYIHIRPERVYVWPGGDIDAEPELYDAHMEEVRSGHSEEPDRFHAAPGGGMSEWDPRIYELGNRFPRAVLSFVSPDGFPFSIRVPVHVDEAARWIRIEADPDAVPLQPGLACLTAHVHDDDFTWQENFQVRGDLTRQGGTWALIPHRVVGGIELPANRLKALRANVARLRRFRTVANRELSQRRLSGSG